MTTDIQTVREEHERFLPYLDTVRGTADSIGTVGAPEVLDRTGEIHEFLAHRLIPHAVAEGRLMLPLVRQLPGGTPTAVGMNQCHIQLGRLTDELERVRDRVEEHGLGAAEEIELRRVLYGLHTLLTGHFAQAEDVFEVALNPDLTPEERARFFEQLERTAGIITDNYE